MAVENKSYRSFDSLMKRRRNFRLYGFLTGLLLSAGLACFVTPTDSVMPIAEYIFNALLIGILLGPIGFVLAIIVGWFIPSHRALGRIEQKMKLSTKKRPSRFTRLIRWVGFVYAAVMLGGALFSFLYNNLVEPQPGYTGPIVPRWVILAVLATVGIIASLGYGYHWILGIGAGRFSKRQTAYMRKRDDQQPAARVRFRSGLLISQYRLKGQKMALFDHGDCHLSVVRKEYLYSEWGAADDVETPILPSGTAEIATIMDLHETPVQDEAEASSIFYGNDGTITYLKAGPVEVVAHSETPYERHAERLIVCHGKSYMAHYGRYGKIELTDYRSGLTVGCVREFLFWGTIAFKPPVPLRDCIFIALLITLDGNQCHPYERGGDHV